jgi:hypothetical protein
MAKKAEHPPRYLDLILWGDHHEPEQETWGKPTKGKELRAAEILSVGFVSAENKNIAELVRDMAEDQLIGARLHLIKRVIISRAKVRIPEAIWQRIKHWNVHRRAPAASGKAAQLLLRRTRQPSRKKARR